MPMGNMGDKRRVNLTLKGQKVRVYDLRQPKDW
jgi:hypothetical protein